MEDSDVTQRVIQKVSEYRPTDDAQQLIRETKLLLVAGTAGSGKNTIIGKLLVTNLYEYIISHTTRAPRTNSGRAEQAGREYYFIDWKTAEAMLDEHRFVEAKLVHGDNLYGTSVAEIQKVKDSGKIGVTDIDVEGVKEYMAMSTNVRAVFLLPPSFEEWMRRLAARGSQDQDELHERLTAAQEELEHALAVGYFRFVVNAELNRAVEDVRVYAEDREEDKIGGDDDTRVEHAWHVLGELKRYLSS